MEPLLEAEIAGYIFAVVAAILLYLVIKYLR